MSEPDNFKQLQDGNAFRRRIFRILMDGKILKKLINFQPLLVGSVPLGLNTSESDVDLICSFQELQSYLEHINAAFAHFSGFDIVTSDHYGEETVTASFLYSGLTFEIFAQKIPSREQMAYRLLEIERMLLQKYGPEFRVKILELRLSGMKTENAICKLLGLKGNPYLAILNFESK